MTSRVVGELRNNLEAKLAIERGRLKTMAAENELPATPQNRLGFRFDDETRTKTTATKGRSDPNLAQLAGPTPGVARGTGDDVPRLVAQQDAEATTVIDTGGGAVELVQAVLEELHVERRRITDFKTIRRHVNRLFRPPVEPRL